MKIAIVVHGRFHAFDLARELLKRDHEVTLMTNYPAWAVRPFGVPATLVRSFWLHGAVSRLDEWLHQKMCFPYFEAALHSAFGHWAAHQLQKERWDAAICFSGGGEETLLALAGKKTLRICHRSSTHIRTQTRLLEEEEKRTGIPLQRPTPWMIAREEREYELADRIYVPSTFVKETFIAEGVSAGKVTVIPLGVQTETFRPSTEEMEARRLRILSQEPLSVLNVGTFSLRKGMWDMAKVITALQGENFCFRFVGPVAPEAMRLVPRLKPYATFTPKQPQRKLPAYYAGADLFILPTIEDGYPVVLAQASAAGLPILTTPNGAGTDLVRPNQTGWVLPVRNPKALIERLQWCQTHREELAAMVRRIHQEYRPRDWAEVAADFEAQMARVD